MSDEELKRLVESNARAIQAMLDERVEERFRHEENMAQLRDAILRLTEIQNGMARMLASLDEDRPTIFRKLNSIESKVDQVLDRMDGDRPTEN